MPVIAARRKRTLSDVTIGGQNAAPVGRGLGQPGDPPTPRPVETPTAPELRMAGLMSAFGLLVGLYALLFAAPESGWIGLIGFVALMMLTLIPARLIAHLRDEGRGWAGWLALWAMTLAAVLTTALLARAEMLGEGGPAAIEAVGRVAALLALAGLCLAPWLRSTLALRAARLAAMLFSLWALIEALMIGVSTQTALAQISPQAAEALALAQQKLALVWPHAPLLAALPALLALRAAGSPFLIAGALFGVAGYAALQSAPIGAASDPTALAAQGVEGVRRLIGACLLAMPAVPIAALAASHRRIRPGLLWTVALLLLAPYLAADVWTFLRSGVSLGVVSETAFPRELVNFARGIGAIAFIALTLLSALWLLGVAAFGRRAA